MAGVTERKLIRNVVLMSIALCGLSTVAWCDQPSKTARRAASLTIKSRVDSGPWTTTSAIYPLKGQKVTLGVKKITKGLPRWYQIIPDISKIYKNCNHPWEPNPYKWVGLAQISYARRELTRWRGRWEVQLFAPASDGQAEKGIADSFPAVLASVNDSPYYHTDVGSFWFQVEVEKDGRTERSPGIEDSDKKGLSPRVFRISVREVEGYLGFLTSFFNVPGVFGSIPYQSNNYIGVDCCDVLVTSYGKWKGTPIGKNYNVDMLVNALPKLAEADMVNGKSNKVLVWGKDFRPGDFIAVKYDGAKRYQHIGALYSDTDKNGLLSADDLVIHAGPAPLHCSLLREGKFDGHVVILKALLSIVLSPDNSAREVLQENRVPHQAK